MEKDCFTSTAGGVQVQSGTIGGEPLWAILNSMQRQVMTRISPRSFRIFSMIMLMRYNFGHYRSTCPTGPGRGPLLAQRVETRGLLVDATNNGTDDS